MNEIYKMLEKYRIVTLQSIHTMIPGVIISYNPIKMEASVLPLGRPVIKGKELEPQPIDRCPVCFSNGSTFSIRNPLKKGDLVIIGFSEVSLEKILTTKQPESTMKSPRFNLSDGIIIGTIDGENDTMPDFNTDDLLIINKETGHKIVFKKDGSIDTTVEIITALKATTINAPNAVITCKSVIASEKVQAPLVDGTNDVTFARISGKAHTHSYQQPEHTVGTANTSAPESATKESDK